MHNHHGHPVFVRTPKNSAESYERTREIRGEFGKQRISRRKGDDVREEEGDNDSATQSNDQEAETDAFSVAGRSLSLWHDIDRQGFI